MRQLTRRGVLVAGAATLPRFAIGQSDTRPSITVAVPKISNTGTLDPLREQSSNASERWVGSVLETLIARDQQGKLERVPGLAAGWKRLSDTTVELTLRPGVKLHDGGDFTAEDVAFSFGPEHMFGASLPADIPPIAKRHWPSLARVEIVDKLTVRFVNVTPDVTMEGRLSAGGSEIVGQRAWMAGGTWLANSKTATGTGPYKVRRFTPDQELLLDAHDAYWGGRPPLKTLRFVEIPEVSARITGLQSGEYHFATDIPPDQIGDIERGGKFEVQGGLVLNHRILAFDKQHPALVDPRVRLAMAHAIDGQAIVDALWAKRARVPAGLQWDFYGDMFIADWKVPEYNPARGRELLKQAGYKGEKISYRVRNNYYAAEIPTAEIIAEFWKEIGLNIQIEVKENWGQVLDKSGPRGVRDWSNSAVFDDPVSSITNQHGPNGAQQQNGEWSNAEMNTLSVALETGTDLTARKKIFARMLQICEREDPAYVVLHQNATFTAKRRDIAWKASPSFFLDFSARNWKI